jgi:hypothetical protein
MATATVVEVAAPKAAAATASESASDIKTNDAWARTHDRVWLGGDYWANPMEDWQIADGGAECHSLGGNRRRGFFVPQHHSPAREERIWIVAAVCDRRRQHHSPAREERTAVTPFWMGFTVQHHSPAREERT